MHTGLVFLCLLGYYTASIRSPWGINITSITSYINNYLAVSPDKYPRLPTDYNRLPIYNWPFFIAILVLRKPHPKT